jgi:ABC-type spermidine/putrescine transport system permease subunit I
MLASLDHKQDGFGNIVHAEPDQSIYLNVFGRTFVIGVGVLLVFILAIGYYITPALLGGPNDQMVSYYIAYFTNVTINWGMACALGALLLAATLLLYVVYGRFTRANVSLG